MTNPIRAASAALLLVAVAVSNAQQIQVRVDGNPLTFQYGQPRYINGRVLVPMRGIFEKLGASVNWDRSTQMVSANRDGSSVELRIGDRHAMVNGQDVQLDVPPMILDNTTLVPIRFVSESLGASVGWLEAQHLVTINTTTTQTQTQTQTIVTTPPQRLRRVILRDDEVIPVRLDQQLSSYDNSRGDTFTATVRNRDADTYLDLPRGTKIEGHIAAVHPMRGDKPAILDLMFDRIRFPDGHAAKLDGTLISLDSQYVRTNANGRLVARTTNKDGSDQRMVYAGYGAGAGLLVGVLTKRPLEDTVLGGALGYILGQVKHDQRKPSEVTLSPGTAMGVKVNGDVRASW
jgi:hypothetical protein